MADFRRDFLRFALQEKVLSFGEFQTKAGRLSPYFFNAGLFNHGAALWQLAQFYARSIIDSKIEFDMLFGPAYKGIVLANRLKYAFYCFRLPENAYYHSECQWYQKCRQ